MAYDRVIEMIIREIPNPATFFDTTISDLNIEFIINRSITFSENTAEFTIYNAKEDTRKKILKRKNNIIFKAGYKDETVAALFIGNITDVKSFQAGPDWVSNITASSIRSIETSLENTYVSLSYAADTLLSRPLADIGAALGLVVFGTENAQINLDNGYTYAGTARGALNYCKNELEARGASLYIDNTEIVIYKLKGRTSRFSAIYLDYDSGLLNINDETEYNNQNTTDPKKITFESLIIPKLQPNVLVNINTEKLRGTFIIEKLTFEGDNFGGDNRCIGEAAA